MGAGWWKLLVTIGRVGLCRFRPISTERLGPSTIDRVPFVMLWRHRDLPYSTEYCRVQIGVMHPTRKAFTLGLTMSTGVVCQLT